MVYECSGPRFDKILNPYTGEPLRPRMSVSPRGRIRFFAPDTYSPAAPCPTAQAAFRAWNRRNGVEGLKDTEPIVCAWTGKPLHLVHDDSGYHYEGGYDPRMLFDRPTFLYYATMRNGVSEYPKPEPEARVDRPADRGRVTEAARRHADESRVELTDDAVHLAESIARRHRDVLEPGPATVSMAGARKKGGKR